MTTTAQASTASSGGSGIFELFVKLIRDWLLHLDINSQLFVEIMNDDALPLSCRSLATGVLMYLRLPIDIINDKFKFLGLIDDVIVMIIGLSLIVPLLPDDRKAYYHQKYDGVAKIDDSVRVLKSTLGVLWDRLEKFVDGLQKRLFNKKTAEQVVQSEELREELHDKTMIFVAELGLSPEQIDSGLAALPPPEKVIGLLGSGLDELQQSDKKKDSPILPTALLKRLLPSGKNGENETGDS